MLKPLVPCSMTDCGGRCAAIPLQQCHAVGLCPGTGIADLAFILVFRLVLSGIHDWLMSQGLGLKYKCSAESILSSRVPSGVVDNFDVTWVDDTVFFAAVGSLDHIVPTAKAMTSTAFSDLSFLLQSQPGYCYQSRR